MQIRLIIIVLLVACAAGVVPLVNHCAEENASTEVFDLYRKVVYAQSEATLRLTCMPNTERVRWSPPEGLSTPLNRTENSITLQNVQLAQSGPYKCTILRRKIAIQHVTVLVCVHKANASCPMQLDRFIIPPNTTSAVLGTTATLSLQFYYYGSAQLASANWSRPGTADIPLPNSGGRYSMHLQPQRVGRYNWLAQLRIADPQPTDAGNYTVQLRLYGDNCTGSRTVALRLHQSTQLSMAASFDGTVMLVHNEWSRLQCNVSAYPPPLAIRWTWSPCEWSSSTTNDRWQCGNAVDLPEVARESINETLLVSSVRLRPTGPGKIMCQAGDNHLTTTVLVRDRHIQSCESPIPVRVDSYANVTFKCEANRSVFRHMQWERMEELVLNATFDGVTIRNASTATLMRYDLELLGRSAEELAEYRCVRQTMNFTTVVYMYPVLLWDTWLIYLSLGVVVGLLTVAVLSSVVFYYYGHKNGLQQSGITIFADGDMNNYQKDVPLRQQAHLLPYNEKFEFPRGLLSISRHKLGSGTFGVVYRAQARGICTDEPLTTVAVKSLQSGSSDAGVRSLISELKIMAHIEPHRNVLQLLGAVTSGLRWRNLILITEYCELGNLRQVLRANHDRFVDQLTELCDDIICDVQPLLPDQPCGGGGGGGGVPKIYITTLDLLAWALQAATGMAHLARLDVLHGDLAARNCLLNGERELKIADFGMSRTMHADAEECKADKDLMMPIKWMALESLRDARFNTTTDVWSFGILLWEMFSLGVEPYRGIPCARVQERLERGHRMLRAPYASHDLHDLMRECWAENPLQRPSFASIVQRLRALMPEQDYELPRPKSNGSAPAEQAVPEDGEAEERDATGAARVPLFMAPRRPQSRPLHRRSDVVLKTMALDPIDLVCAARMRLKKVQFNELMV